MHTVQELNTLALVCQPFTDRNRALMGVVTRIRESLDLDTIFSTTVAEVREILGADRVAIFQFGGSGARSGCFVAETVAQDWQSLRQATDETLAATVALWKQQLERARTRETIEVVETLDQPSVSPGDRALYHQLQVQSSIRVPLLKSKGSWGWLCIHQCSHSRPWSAMDVEFADQIAQNLSIAIQHSSYLEHLKKQRTQLAQILQQKRLAERQKTLANTIHKIRKSLDIGVIFQTSTQETRQLLQVDRVAVYQFQEDWSGEFVAESVAQGWEAVVGRIPKVGERVLYDRQGSIFCHHETWAIDDVLQWAEARNYQECLGDLQARACAAAPIFQMDRLWGLLLACKNGQPHQWQRLDLDFLTQISAQLGIALQQADLLEQTRRQTAEITKAFQQLQQTQMHLIQSEKMASLGQLVAGIAHEINNPVNFIYGNLTYVKDYTAELLELLALYRHHHHHPTATSLGQIEAKEEAMELDFMVEDLPKVLVSMKSGADRIHQLVDSLQTFSRLDRSEKHNIDIHEGLDSALVVLQHRLKSSCDRPPIHIVRDYGELPVLDCYAAQLNQAFFNVINNGIDALEEAMATGHFD
ncbi:GAF domain-containing sensor histidine kinase, partial [Prochlorothrix hollandica]|uniref:GAF domain-containing sensor histidine kinase n=1 Tax=Prochlorothrix hollandica TaxID=1223 RepID=UPI00333FA39B